MTRFAYAGLLAVSLALALLVVGAPVAQAAEIAAPDDGQENVLITVRIGRLEDGKRVPVKSHTLIVAAGSPGSKLLAGSRVPFPAAMSDSSGESDESMMKLVYQNIGFAIEARAWLVDETKVRLSAELEDSRVQAGAEGDPPTVETWQLAVNAILADGVPLELTRVEGLNDRSGFVEIEARILR